MTEADEIRRRLLRHGLGTALGHFNQAESAYGRDEWESANAQIRSFIEALFDGLCEIRLKVKASGGDARKRLQTAAILGSKESALVKSFMDLSNERGSHAGMAQPQEATARRMMSFGVAFVGLSLLPDLVRVEEVLAVVLESPPGTRLPNDGEIVTQCPTCNEEQTLAEGEIVQDGEETVYFCKSGCQRLVVVGLPGDSTWEGRGFRLGEHVIRNAHEVFVPVVGSPGGVKLPASPAALKRKR